MKISLIVWICILVAENNFYEQHLSVGWNMKYHFILLRSQKLGVNIPIQCVFYVCTQSASFMSYLARARFLASIHPSIILVACSALSRRRATHHIFLRYLLSRILLRLVAFSLWNICFFDVFVFKQTRREKPKKPSAREETSKEDWFEPITHHLRVGKLLCILSPSDIKLLGFVRDDIYSIIACSKLFFSWYWRWKCMSS